MIYHNIKSILTSRNLAAGYNLISLPSYNDFKKAASINVTLYGFGVIQGFRAKKLVENVDVKKKDFNEIIKSFKNDYEFEIDYKKF